LLAKQAARAAACFAMNKMVAARLTMLSRMITEKMSM
jgi:hypothetical protein